MNWLSAPLVSEPRSVFYRVVLGVWLMVAAYAVLHDQYLVCIAPEHFTKYHPALFGLQNPALLAFCLAFGASVSPGLALGTALYFVCRAGDRPRIEPHRVFRAVLMVIGISEGVSLLAAGWVYLTREPLYPASCYPDKSLSMLVTQTIQLTCYLVSGTASATLLVYFWRRRFALKLNSRLHP